MIVKRRAVNSWLALLAVTSASGASLQDCPGYKAVNVQQSSSSLKAELVLAGAACNVYGNDIQTLALEVDYEDTTRIHLRITDPSYKRYEVPNSVLPRPENKNVPSHTTDIRFHYVASPFSFSITRRSNGEVLFDTTHNPLVFEPQYWNLKTNLPANPHIYGLGEHTDPFQVPSSNYTRTMWSRDAYAVPSGTNLYGNHPIYFEHRTTGTHGVFLVNSNGMDIKIDNSTLEYNVIGGIIEMYFLAGSTEDPFQVARQYAQIVGTPAEVPYWSFGFHQCRFGYQNFIEVSQVITNYSAAGIPLETMWTDIDYMDERKIFTADPVYFPLEKMREIVSYLHAHDQKYILMVDPAVGYSPNTGYGTLDRGLKQDVFMKNPNGTNHLGVVWPGVAVFPDWFHPNVSSYWDNEFKLFFNPDTGIDIDGVWIDMNEPSSFCAYPCTDPYAQAEEQHYPPTRTSAPPDPSAPIFQSSATATTVSASAQPSSISESIKRETNKRLTTRQPVHHPRLQKRGLSDQQIMNPPYNIANAAGQLSNRTAYVDAVHYNGLNMYDTHNMYGTLMSVATRNAMFARRPAKKTLVITRSTFAGAGAHVGKWLGDNLSDWVHYRFSIAGMLGMATIYQIPMVGSDVCGFADDTNEILCARWATLGAFNPFYRNHNIDTAIPQEFYRWPLTTAAAKNAIDMRYRLLDYLYTAFHKSNADGTPVVNPLFFKYPKDANTFPIDLQFLFGESILISPVTEENSTSVTFYLPRDTFYDFKSLQPVIGEGKNVTLDNVAYTDIPLHIIGGSIIPLRARSTNTTTELREQPFAFIIAPSGSGSTASGSLYIDDGVTLAPPQHSTTNISMTYAKNSFKLEGTFRFEPAPGVESLTFLGLSKSPRKVSLVDAGNGSPKTVGMGSVKYNATSQSLLVDLGAYGVKLDRGFEVELTY